jgi:hypothetical protein
LLRGFVGGTIAAGGKQKQRHEQALAQGQAPLFVVSIR